MPILLSSWVLRHTSAARHSTSYCIHTLRLQFRWDGHVDMHGLDVRVRRQPSLAELPSNTALLDTAKGNSPVTIITGVDPDHTSLDPLGDPVSAGEVGSEDGAAQ